MKRLLFFICTLLCANVLLAFTIDSLSYSIISISTNPPKAKVHDANLSITTANILATVTYQGTTYSVTSIGAQAFRDCDNLTSVTIPNSVTYIGYEAFRNCISLTSVTIPNSVTSTGGRVFERCLSLTSVTIPNSVTSINFNAFRHCSSLTSVTIPNSVTSIGQGVFEGCSSLTSVTIGNSVTSIGINAFRGCYSLTSVTIPNSVTSIRQGVFEGCSSLTSVTIGNSVTSIGIYAFQYCRSLTSVTSLATNPPALGEYAFCDIGSPSTLYVPNGCRQAYVNSAWAQWFDCIVELGSGATFTNLNVEVNNEEWGSVEVNEGCGTATLTAVAEMDCSEFLHWNDGDTNNPRVVNVASDTSFTAIFEELPNHNYNVNVSINNDSFGSVSIENDCNSSTLTATANNCYQFVSWNDGNTENPRVVNVSSDTSFTAIFEDFNTELSATICQGQVYTENGFNVSEAGVYTQTLTSANGCDSIVTLTVSVNPTFDTTINATINAGETYAEFGFNESEAGTYVQNLQSINGCDSTINLVLSVNSSLLEAEIEEISFFPNPTKSKITFSQAIEKVEVIDLTGKAIFTFTNAKTINIESLPAGAYYLRLTNNDKAIIQKVIKQ